MDESTPPPPAEGSGSPPPPPPAAPTTVSGSPTDFLKGVVGKRVVVRLTSGVDYRGVLSCLDGYMNIALEQTEEHVNGRITNRYGDAFIRGNNGAYVSPLSRKHVFLITLKWLSLFFAVLYISAAEPI
ncbi:Sm-like ribonucleo protein [Gloeophyllum trabeum ATCC 11539]|uniref:U6 snRNA-associated Sm-like protein LSm6 n=1 Tax=Gloeophyllum trabeum (strain ATCC 11539 / FP-39264 / Madison 617) TaxID=670483 RepID=S7QP77_GLOTA|nr:Sm-like ribonucleoprotein [Gloeophyllum trabeum ATCC 11539]EPQ61376.1 Sm-like ribonucleo protein [Gloeophyllum trabeum ATCC 11539]